MLLKNKIRFKLYLSGTILNYLLFAYLIGNPSLVLVFLLGIILNQIFLMRFGLYALEIEENTTLIPTFMYGVLKLLVLVASFIYAMQNTVENEHFWVIYYIFQLIIFTISIKTNVKKIKD